MKRTLKKTVVTVMAVSGVLLEGMTVVQAEDVQKVNLDNIVVTATRTEKDALDVPANTQVITAEDIKKGGYTSVFEAVKVLAQANSFAFQEDGGDYGSMMSRIKLRGIDDGTLVLVNGNPSNYMNHATLNNIPIDQVERIEIVKGANSALYGPQAIGGVINIITKKPVKTGKVTGNISSALGSREKSAAVNVQTDVFNLGVRKTFYKDYDGIQHPGVTGSGPALDIRDKNTEQLYLSVNMAKDLVFNYGRTSNEVAFESGKFNNYVPIMSKYGYYDTTFNDYSLIYDSKETGVKAVAGYNTINMTGTKGSNNTSWGYNANFDIQKKFDLRDHKDTFILGTNMNREYMKVNYPPYANDVDNGRNSYSLYESYDYKATDKLSFIAGMREYYMTKSSFQDSDFQLLPQFQGLYKVNDKSSYYFNIGKSFEMPDITSSFWYGDSIAINPDLKPQSGWSYELGHKFENGKSSITTDVFYMTVKDKFYWAQTQSGQSIMKNHDKWQNTGLEINYKQKIDDNLSTNIGLTLQNPKAYSNSSAKWVQDSAKYIINVGADYNKNKFMADARIFANLDREPAFYNYERTSSSTPDHNLSNSCDLTVTLGYKPTDTDSFKIIGRNLFNRKDVVNTYEYYALPANVTFVYEKSF
ncbi:TonB-dependent receptor plug domain-containing protein [Pectinatus frisingensis]|uniref:TonB-dependent receptor plug domain-containing protein n=1 Tax=Pectinatus frisingensis TaxID=865 RepID=UPI0015F57911|nr:TonB-dependent receptor [Pectinatus frisingensis]